MHALKYVKFITATAIYAAFAVYLYQPHFSKFNALQYLLPVNSCFAALGCFVLSRRWVSAYAASFFAGAMYGFGPFSFWLTKFHPAASLLAAAIPWLFCPAAFIIKTKHRLLSWPLAMLPFLTIVLFCNVSAHYRLFAIPVREHLNWGDLPGLIAPFVAAQKNTIPVGFYHVPVASLLFGSAMLLTAQRVNIILIFCLGTVLAFSRSFSHISPIMWLTIPVLCCSCLIGAGTQALATAGYADRKWVLLAAIFLGLLTIVTLLPAMKYFQVFVGLADSAKLFIASAKMYLLGTITAATIYFLARTKLRLTLFRWIVLCSAMAVDIFLSATFIVDKVL
jgi:hypothetical protein